MKKIVLLALTAFLAWSTGAAAARPSLASIQASIEALTERIGDLEAAHTGARLQNQVTLVWVAPGLDVATVCQQPNKEFRQIFPDGSFAPAAFVVPIGKIFVATDVDAVIVAGLGNTFGLGRTVHAVLTMQANALSSLVPHTTPGVAVTTTSLGAVSISSQLVSPVLIGSGQQVCVRGDERSSSTGFIFRNVASATVRGYLVDEPTP